MNKKILVLTGGPVSKLDLFRKSAKEAKLNVLCASFYDLSYLLERKDSYALLVQGLDVAEFDIIYIRVIGKRIEEASLVIDYAKEKKIRLVDRIYNEARLIPSTILKTLELKMLFQAGIPIPTTYHARLRDIFDNAEKYFGFPYVIKASIGQKARSVWAPKEKEDAIELYKNLREIEKQGRTFFAQKMIESTKRARILVVGKKVLGGVIRSTKFRKRFQGVKDGKYPAPIRQTLKKVPHEFEQLALRAAEATFLEIAGVDILIEDKTGKLYVIEANAAPSWNLISKYTDVDVESEILKYLFGLNY